MAKYYIGTAGWSYEDWEGIVYPEPRPRGFHPLAFLAEYVNLIEINSTFYRPASAAMALSWVRRVEAFPEFLFALKLHQVFTHKRSGFTAKDVDDFRTCAALLASRDRLAAVLIQFPWSFGNTSGNMEYLARLFGVFSEFPLALEVRHASWDVPVLYRLLEEKKVAYCNIDQPLFNNSIKPSAVSTTPDFAYVRLHGRNTEDWFREGAGRDDRYNYFYAQDELQDWIDRIKSLGMKSGKVFVITNNHYRGQAMANALQIKNMITGQKLDIPELLVRKYPVLEEIIRKIRKGQMDLFEDKDK
jgi:uncharacterized protein YecE (DUF72 family)